MKLPRLHARLDALAQVTAKAGAVIRVDAEILIHVKERDARPVHPAERHQRVEELELRIARGEDGGRRALPRAWFRF